MIGGGPRLQSQAELKPDRNLRVIAEVSDSEPCSSVELVESRLLRLKVSPECHQPQQKKACYLFDSKLSKWVVGPE